MPQAMFLPSINYNGRFVNADQAPAPVSDSVFRARYGLFESMLVINQDIQLKDFHFDRLLKGIDRLGYKYQEDLSAPFFEEEVLKTIRHNKQWQFQRVRLQVFYEDAGHNHLSFVIENMPVHPDVFSLNREGLHIGLIEAALKPYDHTANLKTINPELYTSGAAIAGAHGWDDVLLMHNGRIAESGIANIFLVKDNLIYTPPLSGGCVAGVMRRYLLETLHNKYHILEEDLDTDKLFSADEVFLTNAVRRIKWIKQIGTHFYSNELTSRIHSELFS